MTFDQLLAKIQKILPECSIEESSDGELVVYTGMTEPVAGGELVVLPNV